NGTEDNCIRVVVELERVLAAATREIIYSNDRTDDDETERRTDVVGAAGDVPGHGIGPGTEIEGVGAEASLDGAADEGVGVRAKIEPVIAGTAGEVLNRLVVADDEDSPDDVALVGPGDGPDQRTGVIAQIELIKAPVAVDAAGERGLVGQREGVVAGAAVHDVAAPERVDHGGEVTLVEVVKMPGERKLGAADRKSG